jgi:hypothetical protein
MDSHPRKAVGSRPFDAGEAVAGAEHRSAALARVDAVISLIIRRRAIGFSYGPNGDRGIFSVAARSDCRRTLHGGQTGAVLSLRCPAPRAQRQ